MLLASAPRCSKFDSMAGYPMDGRRPASHVRQLAAAIVGNVLEWYDFIIFGLLTVVISHLFFPTDSQYASLLLTTATFGVGFFMRPIGGLLLGIYADRKGRKAALLLIIGIMTVAIGTIAFAPTYAAVGIAAPLLIVFARLLQGFATGGEFSCATTFLVEIAPAHRRYFYGSWQMFGLGAAVLMGTLLGALVTHGLTSDELERWGWRIPFLFGLIIGPVGLYVRRHLVETTDFVAARAADKEASALGRTLAAHGKAMLACLGLSGGGSIQFYVLLIYMPTFASTQLHLPLSAALVAQAVGLAFLLLWVVLFGALADRAGPKPIMITAFTLYLGLAYPLFSWVHDSPSLSHLTVMQIVLCSLLGAFYGPFATVLVEQFPTRIRSTGLAIPYNLGVMVFGGFAQFFVTWLVHTTGSPIAPVFYVMFGAAIALVSVIFINHPARDPQVQFAVKAAMNSVT
jgi:MHS family proline/betaine transporter-like MFS transporter